MKRRVVIVTPVYRSSLTADEMVSIRHLRQHLSAYERVIIAPADLQIDGLEDFRVVRFSKRYFEGIRGYNNLMLTRRFYRAFREYEFILIYQLDALVFSDDLSRWCREPWDFVGAPVFDENRPESTSLLCLNGGFSLRRTQACLDVLTARACKPITVVCLGMPFMERNFATRLLKRVLIALHQFGLINVLPLLVSRNVCHEDFVWTRFAPLFDPAFRVPPAEVAREFAFEQQPARLYESNSRRLPFGCHAWARWDPHFWQPFLSRRTD